MVPPVVPPKSSSFSPAARAYLHAWPAGEVREFSNLPWYRHGRPNSEIVITELEKAQEQGYIVVVVDGDNLHNAASHNSYGKVAQAVRTEQRISLYKPRGAQPDYAEKNPWPWSVDAHWEKIQRSKARVVRGVAKKITNSDAGLAYRYPEVIQTKSELVSIRKELLAEFGKGIKRSWGPPVTLRHALTGELIHMLFMELLVEPRFDEAGKFQRFVPVTDDVAFDERERIIGGTNTIKERYLKYVRSLNRQHLTTAA